MISLRPLRSALLLLCLLLAGRAATAQETPADSLRELANGSRFKGDPAAPITIVEISDFECPFCRQFAEGTLPALDSALVRTSRARLVFLNYPMPNHPSAWIAAEAALCAGEQGAFWPMHDRLFAAQEEWTRAPRPAELFRRYAAALTLDGARFQECVDTDRVAPVLVGDLMQSSRGGVSATPTFIVVREPRPGENPELAQRVLAGAQPLSAFLQAVEELTR